MIWTVTDASGRTATCTQLVTVKDHELPTIICKDDQIRCITIAANNDYTAIGAEFDPVSFSDNCTGATISNNFNGLASLAGAAFPSGPSTVIWTVEDASGNETTCDVVVTINPRPTVVVSGDATICSGTSTQVKFDFTGTGPWNLTYSDGVTTYPVVTGITVDPYYLTVWPATRTWTYTATA
ncbi:MAG: HYR domain-containing protein [Marinilabiliales bacterium]|nr:HYR domain-containing protein [Marinilabiliales bacterium]